MSAGPPNEHGSRPIPLSASGPAESPRPIVVTPAVSQSAVPAINATSGATAPAATPSGGRPIPVAAHPMSAAQPIPVRPKAQPGQLPVAAAILQKPEPATVVEQTWRDFIRNAPAWLVSAVFHMLLLII